MRPWPVSRAELESAQIEYLGGVPLVLLNLPAGLEVEWRAVPLEDLGGTAVGGGSLVIRGLDRLGMGQCRVGVASVESIGVVD